MIRWHNSLRANQIQRLGREAIWIILGQAVAVSGSLVGLRLLTELLDPAIYGELNLAMTLATLVSQTVLGPLSSGILRFYAPAVEKDELGSYLIAVRQLVLLGSSVVIVTMLLTVGGLLIATRIEWIAIAIASLVFACLNGYNSILDSIQNAARQRATVALHQGAISWMRFLIAAGLLLWLGTTSIVAMGGYIVATILVIGSQYMFFRKIVPQYIANATKARNWRDQIWKYSWPFATWGIFTWTQLVSDRWALGIFATTKDVGLYAVLFQLGYYPISMFTGMALQLLAPIFYTQAGDASDNQRNAKVSILSWRLTGFALGITGIVFLTAQMFHTQIFHIFVARQYISASHLLPWLVLAGGIFAAGQTIALNLMSQMKTHVMVTAKIVTALLGVIFNFVGAYWEGTLGIVIAGVLFSILYFSWMVALSINTINKPVSKFGWTI